MSRKASIVSSTSSLRLARTGKERKRTAPGNDKLRAGHIFIGSDGSETLTRHPHVRLAD
jgi:hypothetical protein